MAKLKAKAGGKKPGRKSLAGAALDRSPSHLLHRALQLALDIYAEETGPDAVTQRQYAVLSAVSAQEGLTQTDLVRATGIDRSTLADLVARMIGKGLLARQRSASDARILELLPARKRDGFLGVLREIGQAAESEAETVAEPKPKKKKKEKAKPAKAAKVKAEKAAKPPKAEKVAGKPADKKKKAKKAAPEAVGAS
jgi:hypothetical protein